MNLDDQIPRRTGFYAVLRREAHIIAHSPFYLLFMLILPLCTFGMLAVVFYNEIPRDLPVLICDGDNSSMSRLLIRMVDASPALAVAGNVHDIEQGADQIREGKAYAIFYIPAGLEHDVKRGEAPAVTVFYNNQWLLVSGLISRAAREVVGTFSAGIDIRTREMRGEPPAMAFEHFEPIRADLHLLFNPNLNYRYFLLPALLANMIQCFVIMVAVRAIGGELKHGTAGEWLAVSGHRVWTAVLAKLLPSALCFFVLIIFMLALLTRYLNVPMYGNLWVLIAASVLFVLAYQSVGFFMIAACANLRLANSLAGFFAGPAFAFGGITYPYIGMPFAAKIWSVLLPMTHYLAILLQQALRGAPPQASASGLGILGLFVVVPPLLLMPRMKRLMSDAKYWGRL